MLAGSSNISCLHCQQTSRARKGYLDIGKETILYLRSFGGPMYFWYRSQSDSPNWCIHSTVICHHHLSYRKVDKELEELLIANLTLVNIQERLWRRDVDVFVSWLMYLSFSTTLCVKLSIGWAHRRLLSSVWRTAKHPEPFHTPKSKIHQILWILLWSVRWKEEDGMSCAVQRVIWEITSVIQIAVEFKMNCVGYRKWKCNETYTRVTQ